MYTIEVNNAQTLVPINGKLIHQGVEGVLQSAGLSRAVVSVAIVDDARIHRLNRQYLDHDYPTDVLSFLLESDDESLEGEIIISAQTADRQANHFGWLAEQEILLYVIHGALHLVGYDDQTSDEAAKMRAQESFHLQLFGWRPPWEVPQPTASSSGSHWRTATGGY